MKRLLLVALITVAPSVGAAGKPSEAGVWTNEKISELAATTYSQYQETQDLYSDGSRRNGDMRVILNEEKSA